jgi:hypothetical protein
MQFRYSRHLLLLGFISFSLGGCLSPEQKAKKAEKEKEADKAWKHQDDAKDTSTKAFIGRLRKAVALKDVRTLSSMMTEDFGYNWTPGSDGYGCFKYWDDNDLWPVLKHVVDAEFMPNGDYLTSPPEFFADLNYAGFRAGIKRDKGSMKFAYFVPAQNVPMAQPPAQGN